MTTMTDILEKHAHLKRCRSVKEGGCGDIKTRAEFPYNVFVAEDGERRRHYCSYCRKCKERRRKANNGKNAATKRQLRHTGEVDPVRKLFFCRLRPTPLSIELRAQK